MPRRKGKPAASTVSEAPAAAPRRETPRHETSLEKELADLPLLERAALIERFVGFYGFKPPPRFSRNLMVRAVAYKLQEKVYGGLKPATRRFLLEAGKPSIKAANARQTPNIRFKSGTILMREWQGVTHQVTVLELGFLFRGKRYRSLSEIACVITGAHWSGPAFFGLKRPPASGDHERK